MKIDDSIIYALVEEQLTNGNRVKINVGGNSMLPTLSSSDTILLEPLYDEPHEGDVLLFRIGDNHIIHRLVRRDGDTFVMQGDNNYGTECVKRDELLGRLVSVTRADGTIIATNSTAWKKISRLSLRRQKTKHILICLFGRSVRRQLRPWYFLCLAILMWAPLGGVPLDNFVLGLRMDHLLHASVFIPCSLFIYDLYKRKWAVWLTAVAVGVLTESVQAILPYRGFDINDMIANFLGVSLGWILIMIVKHKHQKRTI